MADATRDAFEPLGAAVRPRKREESLKNCLNNRYYHREFNRKVIANSTIHASDNNLIIFPFSGVS